MSLSILSGLLARRSPSAATPEQRPAPSVYLEFPVVLRRRVAGAEWVIAEGPLGVIAEAIACLPTERRNEFTISFAFPAASGQEERA